MNREKVITREEMEGYFHCPLSYRYRYELDIPYQERDKNLLFVEGAKHAVSSWFESVARGMSRQKARNKMGLRLDVIWRNLSFQAEDFPMAHATIIQILLELESNFRESRDLVIGGQLTGALPLGGWSICDTISGIYIEKGKRKNLPRSKRPIVGVQVAPDTSIDKLPSMARLRQAIVKYSLNVGSTELLGSGHPPKLFVIHVPSMHKRIFELEHEDFRETIWIARSILRALEEDVFVPTDTLNKCKKCWYRHKCSNYFSTREPSPKKVAELRRSVESRL